MNFAWLRASTADANRDRGRTDGACVVCPACSREIPLAGTLRLSKEFSVPCPNCGHRNVYQSAGTRDPKQDAEATRTPAKIQFGKKALLQSHPG